MTDPRPQHWRPRRRSDCATVPRPCPYVGCRYNLFLDRHEQVQGHYPGNNLEAQLDLAEREGRDPAKQEHSCALDVAAAGPQTCAEVGDVMGWSKQFTHLNIQKMLRKVRLPDAVVDALEQLDEQRDAENAPYRAVGRIRAGAGVSGRVQKDPGAE